MDTCTSTGEDCSPNGRMAAMSFLMTVALIAVGVELFGLACGVALARAAATDS